MDLICYVYPGWDPRLRPASAKREWMDATPESFAYRCLPLNIANAHGWEALSPCGFEAQWTGGQGTEAVEINPDPGAKASQAPVSLFGQGTITFHIEGLFRTPPGWNLWVGGSPNAAKDGIAPLGGIVETDWSPYTFTMNWRFTRPGHRVRFEAGEPICFFFPVQRSVIEDVQPRLVAIDDAPELKQQFETWSASRNAFQERMRLEPPSEPAKKWQKLYYRGLTPEGHGGSQDHQSKLGVQPFKGSDVSSLPSTHSTNCPRERIMNPAVADRSTPAQPLSTESLQLRRREWMLEVMERQRSLSPSSAGIERREHLTGQEFLDHYYAAFRPVVLAGELANWPALKLWNPEYLKQKLGDRPVEFQNKRNSDRNYELAKHAHKHVAPFSAFIELIAAEGAQNNAYLTAFNSGQNQAALAPLQEDVRPLDKFLDLSANNSDGMMWIGPAGTFTPLHHDLTNNLLVQVVGRKRIILAPPSETKKLYNSRHVFSDVHDILDPNIDLVKFPLAAQARLFDLTLDAGEILYIPVGWWHQVLSLDFSVSITYTNFRWPNDAYELFPAG